MRNDSALRLSAAQRPAAGRGQDGGVGKDAPAFVQEEVQGLWVQSDDQVDLALAVAQAQQLSQMSPVFGTGIAYQVQVLIELVSDTDSVGLEVQQTGPGLVFSKAGTLDSKAFRIRTFFSSGGF